MKPQQLNPVLAVIESGLFPTSSDPSANHAALENISDILVDNAAIPASTQVLPSVQRLMARRANSALHHANENNEPLLPGQIRWISSGADRPVSLLVASLGGSKVQGWLVCSETLYASHQDWLLQDTDTDIHTDPRCAMVQLWNRVELSSAQLEGRAGQMLPSAFLELSQVAARLDEPSASLQAVEPKPGRFGLFEDSHGVAYVCGTPLGTRVSGDPRLHYRFLYLQFSQLLQRRALVAVTQTDPTDIVLQTFMQQGERDRGEAANMPFWRLPGLWRGAGLAVALMLGVVLPIRLWQADTGSDVRTVPISNFGQSARFTVMDIHFSASAPAAGITTLLREAQGRIVSAPTESGAWRIAVGNDHLDAARALFAASQLVVTFDEAQP